MYIKSRIFVVAVALISLGSIGLQSCKDDNCKGKVTVYSTSSAGFINPVPNCKLIFGDSTEPRISREVFRVVYTDANGVYEGEWKNEAVLSFEGHAIIDSVARTGTANLRLQKGTVTEQQLYLN